MNVDLPAPNPKPSSPDVRRWFEGIAVGIVTIALATFPKLAFIDSIGRPTPFLLYVIPVLLATLRGT